jgi:hypothetical protein
MGVQVIIRQSPSWKFAIPQTINHDYALGFQLLRLVDSPVAEEMHRQPSSRPASLKEIKAKSSLLVALEYALITGKAPINTPNYK